MDKKELVMNLAFDFDDSINPTARMKVIGVGGAGGNAIDRMIGANLRGVEFIAINTDLQAMEHCRSSNRIQIGRKTTRGLGAGADPEKGRRAIEEDKNAVYDALADSDLVFVTAGMGGGTGTGAAPVVAEIAKDIGALTVAIVTKPFLFEGPKRMRRAEEGIAALKESCDTLIVIPNQRLLSVVPKETPLNAAFNIADEILLNATKGISDLITIPGLVNLDFADVKAIMLEMGDALMGSGHANGEHRAVEAAKQAIHSPLLEEISIAGAMGVLINITGGPDMTLHEVNDATSIIFEEAGPKANIIFGAVIDPNLRDEVQVTVIATGLKSSSSGNVNTIGHRHYDIDSTKVDYREIPAVDRINELSYLRINRRPEPAVTLPLVGSPTRNDNRPELDSGNNGNGNGNGHGKVLRSYNDSPESNNGARERKVKNPVEGEAVKEQELLKDYYDDSNDDNFDIPACRRRRWSFLRD